jgi:hypothetical protein
MQLPRINTTVTTPSPFWRMSTRLMHWFTATSLAAATILTSQGDLGHEAFGFISLSALIILLAWSGKYHSPIHALWAMSAIVFALILGDWLAPDGSFHFGTTLMAAVLASLYCATVIFELLQRITLPLTSH